MAHNMHMVYLVKKKVKGNNYLYLNKKARVDGKPKVVWQFYLGPENNIEKLSENISVYLKNYEPEVHNFGLPIALMKIAERLNLVKIIDKEINKRNQGLSVGEYILISSINRAVKPTSKAKMKKWFDSTYLQKVLPEINTYLDSNAYTNHFAYLTDENISNIEQELNKMLVSEFGIEMKNIFYDPTNYFTFINPSDQKLPRHGKSKEGRYSLNIINLSLFCTHEGIPIMHRTYAGNTQDAGHFKTEFPKFAKRITSIGGDNSTLTLVFDKGNLSEEVFNEIEKSNINFICSIRPSTQKDLDSLIGEDFEIFTLPNKSKVGLKEFNRKLYNERYRLIVAYSPNRNNWSSEIKFEKIEKKVKAVQEFFKTRFNKNKWRDKENVIKKIKSIIKNKEYFNYIDYEVNGECSELTYDIKIKSGILEKHLEGLGKSYFMTNRTDLSPTEIVWLYRQQYTVEHAFKYIKKPNFIQIRPMYHHKDKSIRGHVFTAVLSLLLTSLLHREVRMEYPEISFMDTIDYLSEIDTVTVKLKNRSITKLAKMSPESMKLNKYLNLEEYL